ncbi:uncharacterized protein LOC119981778 [Tripterygium wilfordii]|uniref:uncharacterized protein LOC119981778 n=1 Tax=Tripterygium wilfordii TaxID=458696 RepID=UPI0018F82C9A|nr:uncharacterized protein LOC119981778 [Tripterygium wilfordii]
MDDRLPIYSPHSIRARKNRGSLLSKSRCCKPKRYIHAIPAIVLISIFILYWFSHPVNVEIRDGRIEAIYQVDEPLSLHKSHVELAILAYAASPIPSVLQNVTGNNETQVHTVSKTD